MTSIPKYIKSLDTQINKELKSLKMTNSELLEVQQSEYDQVLKVSSFYRIINYYLITLDS